MQFDTHKDVQILKFGEEEYVLVRARVYRELLQRLDSLHTALKLQRTRNAASTNLAEVLLKGDLRAEQIRKLMGTPTRGERIKLLREFRNLTQSELAERAQVHQSVICRLETGGSERPSNETIQRVMRALRVPADIISYPLLKSPASTDPHVASVGRIRKD
jgi:DNA-binding XRE family transcriptional regulator